MATATLAPFDVKEITLSDTENEASVVTLKSIGNFGTYATSDLLYNFDTSVSEDDDMSSAVGWIVLASQGYQEALSKMQGNGDTQVNIWSATASVVVTLKLTPAK